MRTPETMTAAQRAARLRNGESTAAPSQGPGHEHRPANKHLDRARASLMSSVQRPSASATLDPNAEVDGSLSILAIDDIEPYDQNPRVGENPKYAEIRASMVANGMTSIITVTRRPGGLKYFPHSGGNTRLHIAKELAAAGDDRFARLRVMIKTWTSESVVLAAHLGENENRGDTSFWEKALGVHAFKVAYEKENPGRSMTGADLTRELKKQGTDFGVRMVQNFLFAVEELGPIGPWLRASEVNLALRPRVGEYVELMQRFRQAPAAASALKTQLEEAAAEMRSTEARNRERDESERRPVLLDVERVLLRISTSLADTLELSVERFRQMSSALAHDPLLQSKDLLSLPEPKVDRASGAVARRQPDQVSTLALAPESSRATAQRRGDAPAQRELGPMAGIVGGTSGHAASRPASADPMAFEAPAAAVGASQSPAQRRQQLLNEVEEVITLINGVVPIHDFVLRVAEMPFGFMVDLPVSASHIGDADVSASAGMRIVVWQFLAALSGQAHDSHWRAVANLPFIRSTRWSQKLQEGASAFAGHLVGQLQVACAPMNPEQTVFDIFVGAVPLWTMFGDAQLGPLSIRLLQLRRALQELEPEAHSALGAYLRFAE